MGFLGGMYVHMTVCIYIYVYIYNLFLALMWLVIPGKRCENC